VNAELLLYALVATVSPFGFAATLVVIASGRGKALLFALAFVLGQVVACAFVVLIGTSFVPRREHDNPTLRGALELAFGAGLIWLAVAYRRRSLRSDVPGAGRSTELLARLQRLRPVTAVLGGLVLGIGGPKRLVLTTLAGTSIAASGAGASRAAALVLAYSAVATLLVWAPVLAFALAGHRVAAQLDATQRWLATHEREIGFYSLLTVGAIAVGHSVSLLI
jgi:Sap, sulfolipid-1-addressing protein